MTQPTTQLRRNRTAAPAVLEALEGRTLLAGDGLRAEYFNSANLTSPALVRTDASVNFAWKTGSPAAQVQADNFRVRWTGKFAANVTGAYTFFVTADDGVRLWIDDKLVVDAWTAGAAKTAQANVNLVSGGHNIRMDYFEGAGDASAKIEWAGPNITRQVISQGFLYSHLYTGNTAAIGAAPAQASQPAATSTVVGTQNIQATAAPVVSTTPSAGSIVVSPGQSIAAAIAKAQPGQTVFIRNGTYREAINITKSGIAGKPIIIQAQSIGGVVIDAAGKSYGLNGEFTRYVTVRGLKVINANNAVGIANAAFRVGGNWVVEDVTVQNCVGCGISIRGNDTTLVRVSSNYNGQIGWGGLGSRTMLKDCNAIGNNTRKNNAAGEAGGVKFYITDGVVVDGGTWANNGGPAIWFDYRNRNYLVKNTNVYGNHGWHQAWAGTGISAEISDGPGVFENNYIHDNSGAGVAIWESMNVTIRRNRIVNDAIDFRNGSGRAPYSVRNIRIEGNTVTNGGLTSFYIGRAQYAAFGIVVVNNFGI